MCICFYCTKNKVHQSSCYWMMFWKLKMLEVPRFNGFNLKRGEKLIFFNVLDHVCERVKYNKLKIKKNLLMLPTEIP